MSPRDAFRQERSSSGKLAYAQHCAPSKPNFNSYLARDCASVSPALLQSLHSRNTGVDNEYVGGADCNPTVNT